MPKIMEIIEEETRGKSYHTYKYSYDSIGVPSIDYDDDPNKVMKWKDSGETGFPKKPIDLKPTNYRWLAKHLCLNIFLMVHVMFSKLMILPITSKFFLLLQGKLVLVVAGEKTNECKKNDFIVNWF